MKKIKLSFLIHDEEEVDIVYYKSKFINIRTYIGEYTQEVLDLNPHLVENNSKCEYLIANLGKLNKKKFNEIVISIKQKMWRKSYIHTFINEEKQEISVELNSYNYLLFLEYLCNSKLFKFEIKTYINSPKIPNDGTKYYRNPRGWRIFYNIFYLLMLFIKRNVFCINHKFVDDQNSDLFPEYCEKCGIRRTKDGKEWANY